MKHFSNSLKFAPLQLSTEGEKVLEKIYELKAQEKTQLDTLTNTDEKDKVSRVIGGPFYPSYRHHHLYFL